ncbi:unnamed protein product [Zymoseptoria tritici ST99CH_3D1]|nr:unnamed protein product [Zymoseptoria tritici ST99CH_3D1]
MSTPPARTPPSKPPRRPAKLTTQRDDGLPPSPTPQPTVRPRYVWQRQVSNFGGRGRIPRRNRLEWRRRTHTLYHRSLEDGSPKLAWRVVRQNPAAFLEAWRDIHQVQDIATGLAASFGSEPLQVMIETFQPIWDAESARIDPTAGLAEQAVRRALTQVQNQERAARDAANAAAAQAAPAPVMPQPTIVLPQTGVNAGRVTRSTAGGNATVQFFTLP